MERCGLRSCFSRRYFEALEILFCVFLCFCGFRVALSLVRCERLGAVKVKVCCGGRQRQMRYTKGGGCVVGVQITYESS